LPFGGFDLPLKSGFRRQRWKGRVCRGDLRVTILELRTVQTVQISFVLKKLLFHGVSGLYRSRGCLGYRDISPLQHPAHKAALPPETQEGISRAIAKLRIRVGTRITFRVHVKINIYPSLKEDQQLLSSRVADIRDCDTCLIAEMFLPLLAVSGGRSFPLFESLSSGRNSHDAY
jgi:hypothetical protein